jgi:hypothetical protein
MMVKASGRSALILATGLFVCFAGPLPIMAASSDGAAATSNSESATPGKSVKETVRHSKRYTHRRSSKVASSSTDSKKSAEKDVADASGINVPAIPASVANANAQLTSAYAADSASAMTAMANTMLLAAADKPASPDAQGAADAALVSSDQLNDVDRALQQTPSTQTIAMASAEPAAAVVMASGNESSTSDQTSLIGKIFIAFGALLTMASAARMFMA